MSLDSLEFFYLLTAKVYWYNSPVVLTSAVLFCIAIYSSTQNFFLTKDESSKFLINIAWSEAFFARKSLMQQINVSKLLINIAWSEAFLPEKPP